MKIRRSRWLLLLSLMLVSAMLINFPGMGRIKNYAAYSPGLMDTLPEFTTDTVVLPFEYKQSSFNFSQTFRLADSVILVLLEDEGTTISIDGYSYMDEGNENICYWLSFNRALAVKNYVMGRGIDSARILALNARSNLRSIRRKKEKEPVQFNCTAEIMVNHPVPPPLVLEFDADGDGIADEEDSCRDEYGYRDRNGCPNRDAIIVPFEPQQSSLFSVTYKVLDSVIAILRKNPLVHVAIEGHAHKKEGVETLCESLAKERADIVKRYMLTRQVDGSRIKSIKSFGNIRPINAARNPLEISRNSRAEIFLLKD